MANVRDLVASFQRRAIARTSGGDVGPHLTRYSMYQRLPEAVPSTVGRHLAISHSGPFCELLGLTGEVVEANYPEHNLLELTFDDASFTSVVSDQVLEHLEGNPQRAFDESARVVEPGGLVVHTTCFVMPIHEEPGDFWRFTPKGLALLARTAGLELLAADGWGSMTAARYLQSWRLRFAPVPNSARHPWHRIATRNDPMAPIVTWVVARKPAEAGTPA
jgi:SAM-dependent methyltransferase